MIQVKRFAPKADIVVILPDEIEEITMTDGGILLPDASKPTVIPRTGEVISCGPEARRAKGETRVYFSAYAGTSVMIDGKEYLWMTDDHIVAGI